MPYFRPEQIRDIVRTTYSAVREGSGGVARAHYTPDQLAAVPAGAVQFALGVGNPVLHAAPAPGEQVLDIGSGGGIDALLAAHAVGPTGQVVGLDMTPEMVARAGRHAAEAGLANVRFVQGFMEEVPFPDAAFDLAISNGVLTLSSRQSRALAEMHRVLRPGGRVVFSDLCLEETLPEEVLRSPAALAG